MTHGSVVNPFGNHADHDKGLRPEFRPDDRRATDWLSDQVRDRCGRGYRRVWFDTLTGHTRGYAKPMLSPTRMVAGKVELINKTLASLAEEYPGLHLTFHCSVRTGVRDDLTTLSASSPVDSWQWSEDALSSRLSGYERLVGNFIKAGGKACFSLDDGNKWPGQALLIARYMERHGIEIVSEPPLIEVNVYRDAAADVGGFGDGGWIHLILRDLIQRPEWARPVGLWWTATLHGQYGMQGLHTLIKLGYTIYDDTRLPEVDRLLVGGAK